MCYIIFKGGVSSYCRELFKSSCEIIDTVDVLQSCQKQVNILTSWKSPNLGMGGHGNFDKFKLMSSCRRIVFVLLLICQCVYSQNKCIVDQCTRQYTNRMRNDVVIGPNPRYCSILRTYGQCIRGTARSCRGDLSYHSTSSLVTKWHQVHNCSYILSSSKFPSRHKHKKNPKKNSSRPRGECMYHGKNKFRHCALFGDPHLRTFHDQFQTCTVKGAWPLIDNAYLVVQVTNGPVGIGYKATAPTKLTVIIKGHGVCTSEKTYEAEVGNLPAAFNDGTKMSDNSLSVNILEHVPGRHIEISIKHIATKIVIRQIGRYLSFAVRIPDIVAMRGAHHRLGLELCVKGCPGKQQINYNNFLADPSHYIKAIAGETIEPALSKSEAVSKCKVNNVTDYYFDSCVFDLLTTGDMSFLEAAEMAQNDVLTLHPNPRKILKNRTHLLSHNIYRNSGRNSVNSAPGRPFSPSINFQILTLVMLIFNMPFR